MVNLANAATRTWFRSAEMEYVSLGVQEHCSHRIITELGRLGVIQFTDLNPELTAFQRRYVKEIKRCDEMDRTLRYFAEMLEKYEVKPLPAPDLDKFLNSLERRQIDQSTGMARPPTATLDELQVLLEDNESELVNLNRYGADFTRQRNHLLEHKHVLEKALEFNFSEDDDIQTRNATSASISSLEDGVLLGGSNARGDSEHAMRFQFVSGIVNVEDRDRFERMVFRATRGNCYMRFASITDAELVDPDTGNYVAKEVFIIFFQAAYIESKLKRICDAFGATQYAVPDLDNVAEIREMIRQKQQDLEERDHVMRKNSIDTTNLLKEIARYLEVWRWTVKREKSVYHTLNHFMADVSGVLRAEGWVVSSARESVAAKVRQVHHEMMGDANHTLPSWVTTLPKSSWPSTVPTFFHLNRFTAPFQLIVSTYGVPNYQEANPAVFTVITFPFLFGVMFGDIGHGLCLFLAALFIVLNEAKFEQQIKRGEVNEIFEMLFGGRYILVLMGFFATYAGFMYNDCFALGLKLFTPTWSLEPNEAGYLNKPDYDKVYPFGVDPTWHTVKNDLVFFNSVKMKMAVIFGVTQMTFGLVLKLMNAMRQKQKPGQRNLDLWYEAVPQIVFMTALFGYMCFLIIYKWSIPWLDCDRPAHLCTPPNLIQVLINLALAPGSLPDGAQMYEGQAVVQVILLLIAVAMIPLMLVPKPYFLIKRMKEEHSHGDLPPIGAGDYGSGVVNHGESNDLLHDNVGGQDSRSHSTDSYSEAAMLVKKSKAAHDDDEEHGVGDIIIHQAIETIEFVLGCISNTASYLRLWALSLAHSQLSAVFWEMALLGNLKTEGAIGAILTFVGYAVFISVTFGVLLCMDNLECFLHSLRLHWVEFQSKFYKGEGVAFAPLSFRNSLLGLEE